ncbi:MAG: hypothetical protein JST42_02875 [Bacteroidetes bacterium]|nr:hypothetical protein [Bacteroidota bacterium]
MITRDNYQEFFLLYVDNELSPADTRAVEEWVAANPDLKEEWESLQVCRVDPDERVIFPGKEGLLRGEGLLRRDTRLAADPSNEYLLSYIDGELSPAERKEAEALIAARPADAAELEQLLLTVSKPDTSVVFPDKNSLYRKEKDRRMLLLWRAVAGAAAVILIAAPLLIKKANNTVTGGPGIALQDKKHANGGAAREPQASAVPQTSGERQASGEAQASGERQVAGKVQVAREPQARTGSHTSGEQQNSREPRRTVEPRYIAKTLGAAKTRYQHPSHEPQPATDVAVAPAPILNQREPLIAAVTETHRGTDPAAEVHSARTSVAVRQIDIRQNDIPKDQSSFATQALLQQDDEKDLASAGQPNAAGKSKLRGLFRKVARTFGSTAERDGEGKREVLIGAFQVAVN